MLEKEAMHVISFVEIMAHASANYEFILFRREDCGNWEEYGLNTRKIKFREN